MCPQKICLLQISSGGPFSPITQKHCYKGCGFLEISEETGVPLYINIVSEKIKSKGELVKELEVIQPVLEYDVIINLPKFKTHMMTGFTGAVKNMFGVIEGLKKAEFHMRFPEKELFAKMIVDVCQTIPPTYNILDGIIAMEGDGS